MAVYNVVQLNSAYNFEIMGSSYIGDPKSNTVMYISKKVERLLQNLVSIEHCLIFAESTIQIPKELVLKHCFVLTDNPQLAYTKFMLTFSLQQEIENRKRKFILTENGYYLGENVSIGENSYIEPGVLIGHDVIIGKNATILAGAVIKNATIGNGFYCNENAVIGANGFNCAVDEQGNKVKIPTLGHVIIGNYVEIGVGDNISAGIAGATLIDDYAKLDALVHVGHDAHIGKNSEITAASIIGGFDDLGENTYMGINSASKNRISLGANSLIGMGAVVLKDVPEGTIVVGNPARTHIKA